VAGGVSIRHALQLLAQPPNQGSVGFLKRVSVAQRHNTPWHGEANLAAVDAEQVVAVDNTCDVVRSERDPMRARAIQLCPPR